jgi:predicted ArsR family transcriptional regulator
MRQLKERDWISERKEKNNGKGRPNNIYSLKVGFNDIIAQLKNQQLNWNNEEIAEKFGETVDRIIELLKEREKIGIDELKKIVPLTNTAILDFMSKWRFIELKEQKIKIASFGSNLLRIYP